MAIIPDHTTPIRVVINEKHSPYPWQVIGNRIATPSRPIRKMLLVASEVNNPADAVLIAAAPELLIQCKNALSYMEVYNAMTPTIGQYELNIANSLRSVIAKAEPK